MTWARIVVAMAVTWALVVLGVFLWVLSGGAA